MPKDINPTIVVRFKIVKKEADGSPCDECGDAVYMGMKALQVALVQPVKPGVVSTPPYWVTVMGLCTSCSDGFLTENGMR